MKLLGVPTDTVESLWHLAEPVLRPAVDMHPGFEMDDVLEAILHRDMQLWLSVDEDNGIKIAWVTQILVYPRIKTLFIQFMAGRDLRAASEHLDELEKFARRMGCRNMSTITRKGLTRWFPDESTPLVFMQRDFGGEQP